MIEQDVPDYVNHALQALGFSSMMLDIVRYLQFARAVRPPGGRPQRGWLLTSSSINYANEPSGLLDQDRTPFFLNYAISLGSTITTNACTMTRETATIAKRRRAAKSAKNEARKRKGSGGIRNEVRSW